MGTGPAAGDCRGPFPCPAVPRVRGRIEACDDPSQLKAWVKLAAQAPTVADIIG